MLENQTVFQLKKLSGWDDIDIQDIKEGQCFRIVVDGVPLINEEGIETFTASRNAIIVNGEWQIPV